MPLHHTAGTAKISFTHRRLASRLDRMPSASNAGGTMTRSFPYLGLRVIAFRSPASGGCAMPIPLQMSATPFPQRRLLQIPPEPTEPAKRFYSAPELAQILRISTATLDNWIKSGAIPAPVRPGGPRSKRFWPREQIEALVAKMNGESGATRAQASAE